MKTPFFRIAVLGFLGALLGASSCCARADEFVAFSLSTAKHLIQSAGASDWRSAHPQLWRLGYMTRVRGLFVDQTNKDVVIIGTCDKSRPALTIDDLAVALRARLLRGEWPLVSIDFTDQTKVTRMQNVRYEGGVENTAFGMDMFDADLRMKKIGQGTLLSGDPGVRSAFDLAVQQELATANTAHSNIVVQRFWFYPTLPLFRVREDVASFEGLKVAVFNEVMAASVNGKAVELPGSFNDPAGLEFARQMTDHVEGVGSAHPSIERLRGLLELVALAHAAELIESSPDLSFWLRDFKPRTVSTPKEQELLHREQERPVGNMLYSMRMEGGVRLTALALRLKSGDPHALKEAALSARPPGNVLFWTFIIGAWIIPTTGAVNSEDAFPLIAQAFFLAEQKRFDDALLCLRRASEAAPDLKDDLSVCRATIIYAREYSFILERASQWANGAYFAAKNYSRAPRGLPNMTTASTTPADMNLVAAMETLTKAHSHKVEPYLLLAAMRMGVGDFAKALEVLNAGAAFGQSSGAFHYFKAKCLFIAEDRRKAIENLNTANSLLVRDDPVNVAAAAKKLLEQVQLNPQGRNWNRYADPEYRYSFEYPRDWAVFSPSAFRGFMAGFGINLPDDFDSLQGHIIVDPTRTITVGIEYRRVGEHVGHAQLRDFWKSLSTAPKEMERKHSELLPGFHVESMNVIEVQAGLRQEIRYDFPVRLLGQTGLVQGRKTGVFQDNSDTTVCLIECKTWTSEFERANKDYFERLISSFKLAAP